MSGSSCSGAWGTGGRHVSAVTCVRAPGLFPVPESELWGVGNVLIHPIPTVGALTSVASHPGTPGGQKRVS